MIINPIIPVWLMGVLCIFFLFLKRKGTFHYIRQILIVLLLFIINLRIMVGTGETATVSANVDVLFVIDNTISMLAEDYNGDDRRIDAVKEDCRYIMEQLPGASFSVVSFGNSVRTMMPYTIDQNNALQAIRSLNGQATLYATGTSLNDVLDSLEDTLDNERDNYQIVFFISDGEITNEEELKSFSNLSDYIDGGAVLGYGTTDGGYMKVVSFTGSDDEPEYLYYYNEDYDEIKGVSKIDEDNLESIASDLDIPYVHMTKQAKIDSEISRIRNQIQSSSQDSEMNSLDNYTDIYYFFVIPLALLLIFDYIYYKRKI